MQDKAQTGLLDETTMRCVEPQRSFILAFMLGISVFGWGLELYVPNLRPIRIYDNFNNIFIIY